MKKLYIKPEAELIDGFLMEPVMKEDSWGTEGTVNPVIPGDDKDPGTSGGDPFDAKGTDWNGWDD